MNFNRKEIYWLTGVILLIIILKFTILGKDFSNDSVIDMNLHDTYFVIEKFHVLLFISNLIFFTVYLIRMFTSNFKNIIANLIFLISNISAIICLTQLISFIESVSVIPGSVEYPPLSGGTIEVNGNDFGFFITTLITLQIVLIFFQSFVSYKTAIYYKHKK